MAEFFVILIVFLIVGSVLIAATFSMLAFLLWLFGLIPRQDDFTLED